LAGLAKGWWVHLKGNKWGKIREVKGKVKVVAKNGKRAFNIL
jgi:hypothetical protein